MTEGKIAWEDKMQHSNDLSSAILSHRAANTSFSRLVTASIAFLGYSGRYNELKRRNGYATWSLRLLSWNGCNIYYDQRLTFRSCGAVLSPDPRERTLLP
jgi:hypothetical protein